MRERDRAPQSLHVYTLHSQPMRRSSGVARRSVVLSHHFAALCCVLPCCHLQGRVGRAAHAHRDMAAPPEAPPRRAVAAWVGRGGALQASYAADALVAQDAAMAALRLQAKISADGRHRFAPSPKTLDCNAFVLRRGAGTCFGCLTTRDVSEADAFRMLTTLAERYEAQFDALAMDALPRATALLREAVLQFNSRTRVDAVRQKVDAVKQTMSSNIDKVLERGERLDDVAAKSETMRDQAATFRAKGRQLRRQLWWQNAKWTALLVVVCLLVAFAVFLAACRGFRCVHK